MKRFTKRNKMDELISTLNNQRKEAGRAQVELCWTGAGHWLKTIETNYQSIGGIFVNDDEFIGFLEGLTFTGN
jgi:hypothetical protein